MFSIAGFGAIAAGYIGANLLWILFLALFPFFATFLNPYLTAKIQRKIDNQELIEVTSTFLLSYITAAVIASFYYGAGALLGWLFR